MIISEFNPLRQKKHSSDVRFVDSVLVTFTDEVYPLEGSQDDLSVGITLTLHLKTKNSVSF